MGDIMDLTPVVLARVLAVLVVSEDLVSDLIRGKSVTQADVDLIRSGLEGIRDIVKQLNQDKPWNDASPSASVSPSISPSASASPSGGV